MLVIKVELHSARDGTVTVLDQMVIYSNGRADEPGRLQEPHLFNYVGHTGYQGSLKPMVALGAKTGLVPAYPQRDKDGEFTPVWHLVSCMLRNMGFGW